MSAQEKFEVWLKEVPQNHALAAELQAIREDEKEIRSRFENDLTFGTAGLRGIMGAGTDRMNVYTVRRAALAYGTYIAEADLPNTCAIAYDTRNNSRLFSETCAQALCEKGIHVYIYPAPAPTPMLSFAVRHLRTGGGVVMTASHNPAAYNGMKCYGEDGCQQTDDPAARVYEIMQTLPMISEPAASFDALLAEGKIEYLGTDVYDHYYQAILNELTCENLIKPSGVKILYTPLHGAGLVPVTSLFDRLGVDYDLVRSQTEPNGDFPTCPYPNPETPEAFNEAVAQMQADGKEDYDVIIATDPDADRVSIAIPLGDGKIRRLSGNELGCMFLQMILSHRLRVGSLPEHAKCIKSIVTTPMVDVIADSYGCETLNVLTGFKYIGSTILKLEKQNRENEIVFSFEESCGFLKGTYVRDKDAQIAAVLAAELAALCKLDGFTIGEKLDALYRKYGYFRSQGVSIALDGEEGKERCADFLNSLRNKLPDAISGRAVKTASDYLTGRETDMETRKTSVLDFPSSNVIAFALEDRCHVILRPSGTEPKLKIYYFAAGSTAEASEQMLAELQDDMSGRMHAAGVI